MVALPDFTYTHLAAVVPLSMQERLPLLPPRHRSRARRHWAWIWSLEPGSKVRGRGSSIRQPTVCYSIRLPPMLWPCSRFTMPYRLFSLFLQLLVGLLITIIIVITITTFIFITITTTTIVVDRPQTLLQRPPHSTPSTTSIEHSIGHH